MCKQKKAPALFDYVGVSVFSALAFVTVLVAPIPVTDFLTLDFKTAVVTLAGLIYGPWATVPASLISCLLEMLLLSRTGLWGFVMNTVATLAFSFTASVLYRLNRTQKGAVLSLVFGVLALTAAMVPANILITPLYTGASREVVLGMIVPLLLPFNFAKGLLNAALVAVLYKPVITAMRRAHLIEGHGGAPQNAKHATLVWFVASLAVAAAAAVILLLISK